VIPGTEDHMTWTVTDSGFAMTLAREVPDAVEQAMREFAGPDAAVILHPGGAGIIDACVRAGVVRAGEPSAEVPRAVLREHGNMSSGTVLFVLERMWRSAGGANGASPSALPQPSLVTAFGPGLTVDSVMLLQANVPSTAERHALAR
jgi:predicted naringenin-chalcone synthase